MPAPDGHQDLAPEQSTWLGDLGSPVDTVVSRVSAPGASAPLQLLEHGFWIQEAKDQVPNSGDLDEYPLLCGFHERECGQKGGREGQTYKLEQEGGAGVS